MVIIPAIDILGARCVRLAMGDYDKQKIYELTPLEAALKWQSCGAQRLHLVDLDGARSGHAENFWLIKNIAAKINIPVEVGGGIRNNAQIENYFESGISYIILSSILFKDINSVKTSLFKYRERVIAGIDVYEDKIAISGWAEKISLDLFEAVKGLYEDYGITNFIFTDIKKDGMLKGPDKNFIFKMAELKMNFVISGGISGIGDIKMLLNLNIPKLKGVITGKALYDGKLDLKEALNVIEKYEKARKT